MSRGCTNCTHHKKRVNQLPCKNCFNAEHWESMTNNDRINAMSIEEKAEFLILSPEMEFDVCLYCEHVNPTPTDDRGWCLHDSEVRGYGICLASAKAEAFKKWLQQPFGGADQ